MTYLNQLPNKRSIFRFSRVSSSDGIGMKDIEDEKAKGRGPED